MQGERNDTIPLNGKENPPSYETVPYDIRDGIMAESRGAERTHNVNEQMQVYAPQEYTPYEFGDGMHTHGEKLTSPSRHWPKKAWWAVVATAILFFLLGGAATLLLMPVQVSQVVSKPALPQPISISLDNLKYNIIVQNDIANALHLDPLQITAQLQAGKSMTEIAAAQGVSSSELQKIELKAFADAYGVAVKAGDIDQRQADEGIKQLQNDPQLLDKMTTMLFLSSPIPPSPTPTIPGAN